MKTSISKVSHSGAQRPLGIRFSDREPESPEHKKRLCAEQVPRVLASPELIRD